MIIDGHCHAGRADGLSHPSDTRADLQRYARRALRAGIGRTVLFAPLDEDYRRANELVAQLVAANRHRYIGFVFINPSFDRGRVSSIVNMAVNQWGFRGIKVHWRNGRITREVMESALQANIPVLYDPRGDTTTVELVLREYPDVALIIPHLGSFAGDWGAQVALIDKLRRHRNLFVDSSGVQYFDLLVDVVRYGGVDRLIFGSDGPFLHPGAELEKIRLLGLEPPHFALVAGGTMSRLLAPTPRPMQTPVRALPRTHPTRLAAGRSPVAQG
jgi:uncharacterized protein